MDVGQFDQIVAAVRDLAQILSEHYTRLRKAGFTRAEALELTKDLQRTMILGGR